MTRIVEQQFELVGTRIQLAMDLKDAGVTARAFQGYFIYLKSLRTSFGNVAA